MVRPAEGLGLAARVVLVAGNMTRTLDSEEALAGAKVSAVAGAKAGVSAAAGAGALAGAWAEAWDNHRPQAQEMALPGNKHPFIFRNVKREIRPESV
ncbi:MAG: hypothetical protein SVS15_01990 [Thermodesulfobacteriota bacterium]|nr:hypothetical protein [Thermodesulfobacteriota bacterium]